MTMSQFIENDGQRLVLDPKLVTPRPLSEYHEDMGPVLWWKFPIVEPPYVGTPLDLGHPVEVALRSSDKASTQMLTRNVGGCPGYHTHWTPLPIPEAPL